MYEALQGVGFIEWISKLKLAWNEEETAVPPTGEKL